MQVIYGYELLCGGTYHVFETMEDLEAYAEHLGIDLTVDYRKPEPVIIHRDGVL